MLLERKDYKNEDETIGYIESIFNSDNILKTTYFPKNNMLYIAFSRGTIYSYSNFTIELYKEFENAESQGKFFHKHINNNKSHYSRKEFTLYPNEVNEIKYIVENYKQLEEDDDE